MWCRLRTVSLLSLLSLALGCGGEPSPRQSIYGKVTLDGEPVDKGVITFKPAAGTTGPVVGNSILEGEYELEEGQGPVTGEWNVEISRMVQGEERVVIIPGEEPDYVRVETIPPQYNKATTLKVTVKEGSNEHDFILTSQGGS